MIRKSTNLLLTRTLSHCLQYAIKKKNVGLAEVKNTWYCYNLSPREGANVVCTTSVWLGYSDFFFFFLILNLSSSFTLSKTVISSLKLLLLLFSSQNGEMLYRATNFIFHFHVLFVFMISLDNEHHLIWRTGCCNIRVRIQHVCMQNFSCWDKSCGFTQI